MQRSSQRGPRSSPPEAPVLASLEQPEEVLVADARGGLTPSDMVERKLLDLVCGAAVGGSHLRMDVSGGRGRAQARRSPR